MRKNIGFVCLIFMLLSIPVIVFGAELSREQAKKLLPVKVLNSYMVVDSYYNNMTFPEMRDNIYKLQDSGFVTLDIFEQIKYEYVVVKMTDKMKPFIKKQYSHPIQFGWYENPGKDNIRYDVLYSTYEVGEITGIKKMKLLGTDYRIMEFKWIIKRSPIGNILPVEVTVSGKENKTGKATFELYDDGWRFMKWGEL